MNWCKRSFIWFGLGVLFMFSACQSEESERPAIYFDSEEFLNKEWTQLEQIKYAEQELVFNEQKEHLDSVPVDSASFQELFELFKKANINKVIYSQEYLIDTFWVLDAETLENTEVINYYTNNNDLPVEWFHVYSDGTVKFKMAASNFLFYYEKEVYYEPNFGFSIISSQKSLMQDTLHIFKTFKFI